MLFSNLFAQSRAEKLLSEMTLEEKIGQLFMPSAYSNKGDAHLKETLENIQKYHLGGLILMQGSPFKHTEAVRKFRRASKTPLLIAADAEWGVSMRLDSVERFPYQITMGALRRNEFIEKAGFLMAKECKTAGIDMNFAPVCDVNNNINNPVINFRSFGENKKRVAEKSVALTKGLQSGNVLACAKHFPGHGDTDADSHYTLPLILHDRKRLEETELYPFRALFDAEVASVMVAHLYIPKIDSTKNRASTLSPLVVNDLLVKQMNFKGLIFTDALNMKGVTGFYKPGETEVLALEAGNDVLLFSENLPVAFEAVREAVLSGRISVQRIEHSCLKILRAKEKAGLLELNVETVKSATAENLNTNEKRQLCREIYEEAQTVLKNKNNKIPFGFDGKTKFITLSIGAEAGNIFQKRVSDYTESEHFSLANGFDKKALDSIKKILLPKIGKKTQLIISLHIPSIKPAKNYGISDEMRDAVAAFSPKSTLVFLGNPYALKAFELSKADFLSVHYQDNDDTRDLAAQMLFGGSIANGSLPVTVGKYKEGAGLILDKKIRFSFILPEKIGVSQAKLRERVDALMREAIVAKAFPGGEIIAAKDGEVFFRKSYGYTTYDSAQKNEENLIYDFASITKITAALPALMHLYERGKINLDKGFDAYLREYKNSNKAKISLREMLAHQGGLKAWIPFWKDCKDENGNWKPNTFSEKQSEDFPHFVVPNLYLHKNYPDTIYKKILLSPVGEKKYVYSDLGFYLYPKMVEKISGKKIETFLKDKFYDKIGASSLGFNAFKRYDLRRIVPTEYDSAFRQTLLHGTVNDEGAAMLNGISGHAGLFGTALDLAKMMQTYLNKGTYGGVRLFRESTIREFTRCQYCEADNRRALGFDRILSEYNEKDSYTAKSASAESFGHTGFTGTFTWADPKNGLLVVFMSNRVNPSRNNRKIMEMNIRPRLHQIFYDCLSEK